MDAQAQSVSAEDWVEYLATSTGSLLDLSRIWFVHTSRLCLCSSAKSARATAKTNVVKRGAAIVAAGVGALQVVVGERPAANVALIMCPDFAVAGVLPFPHIATEIKDARVPVGCRRTADHASYG